MTVGTVRDDNLRLVLSDAETRYIAEGIRDAKSGLIGFSVVGAIGLGVFIGTLAFIGFYESSNSDSAIILKGLVALLFLVVIVAVPFCFMKAIGALFRLLKFRSYRNNHQKFLEHYRRSA